MHHIFIEIPTPAGKFNLDKLSTVELVGSMTSMTLLCVLNSNCSLDLLSICGPLMTVNLSFLVGKGTGPTTLAPVLMTVSTILEQLRSMIRLS